MMEAAEGLAEAWLQHDNGVRACVLDEGGAPAAGGGTQPAGSSSGRPEAARPQSQWLHTAAQLQLPERIASHWEH